MRTLLVSGLALAMAAPVLAQTTFTSPSGYLTREGTSYAYYGWNYYANGHTMISDSGLGTKARVIKQIDMRLDSINYTRFTGTGKSWTRVTIDCSDGLRRGDGLVRLYSMNVTSTPTRVYDSKVSLGPILGAQTKRPWGGQSGELSFPFKSSHVYTGKAALIQDWKFNGGKLSNNAAWSGSTARSYPYLDSVATGSVASGRFNGYRPTTSTCKDSSVTRGSGAWTYFSMTNYAKNYTSALYAGKSRIYSYTYYIAKGAPYFTAWGFANASAAGVDIGDACRNMLHIDARLPFVVFPRRSHPTSVLAGYVPGPASNSFLPPMITSAVGVKMAAQSAWTDSRSKLFKLTRAATVTLPGAPMVSQKEIVYSPDQKSTSGNRNFSHYTCPLMRYTN